MKQAAIYARYSSHAQDGGTSIEVQVDACRRALDGQEVHEYIDRAKTGRAMAGREAFLQLLADARAGTICKLVVHKYDRLGRSLAETATIVAELEDLGVQVISVTEGQDSLVRGVHLAVAEWYSKALSERVSASLHQRFKERAFTGGRIAYGYKVAETAGRKYLAVDEEQAKVVRWVFREFLSSSVGLKELARRLNARGIKPQRRSTWTWTTLRGMLRNDSYIGEVIFNRNDSRLDKHTGRKVRRPKPPSEWMTYHEESLRIVPEEEFQAVRRRLGERANARNRSHVRGEVRMFTGLLYCGECGSLMYRKKNTTRYSTYIYYECGERHRNGNQRCHSETWVREDLLVASVTETLMGALEDTEGLVAEAVGEAKKAVQSGRQESRRIRAEIGEVDRAVGKLTRLLTDEAIEDAAKRAISRQLAELEAKRDAMHKTLAGLADTANDNTEALAEAVRKALDEAKKTLSGTATPAELNDLFRKMVGEMCAHPDGTFTPRSDSPTGNVKGGRYVTRWWTGQFSPWLRDEFWRRFSRAA